MGLKFNFFTGSKTKNPWSKVRFGETLEEEPPAIRRSSVNEYDFENPSVDEFAAHINRMPTEAEYGPSKMRRVMAGLVGGATGFASKNPAAAFSAAESINRTPYRNAMSEWNTKADALEANARLQNSNITQRRLYQGMENTADYREEGNEIKRMDAVTRQFNAETARKRNEFSKAIAEAKDETTRMRLTAQKEQWEKVNNQAGQRLSIARDRANAYSRNVDSLNDYRKREPTVTKSQKDMIEEEIIRQNPQLYLDKSGNIKPEAMADLQMEIDIRLRNRRGRNVNLPAFNDGTDDWVLEK